MAKDMIAKGREEIKSCLLCGANSLSVLFNKKEQGIDARIFKCLNCDIVFIYPQTSEDKDLKSYYQYAVYPKPTDNLRFAKRLIRLRRFQNMPLILKRLFLKRFILPRGENRILDIGCNTGMYLALLKELGWQTYGVEINKSAVEYARTLGLNVFWGQLEDARFPSAFFDVIRIVHVIEHVNQPVRLFEEMSRILKRGGLIYLETPNQKSWAARCFKERWLGIGSHIFSFSVYSLDFICRKVNLRIKKINYKSSKGITLDSIRYTLENRPFLQRVILKNKIVQNFILRTLYFFLMVFHKADTLVVEIIKE